MHLALLHARKLGKDQLCDQSAASGLVIVERFFQRGQDELSQQAADLHKDRLLRQLRAGCRIDVDRAHRQIAAHRHAMRIGRRHPQRERGRDDPGGVRRLDLHGAGQGMDELPALVEMQRDLLAIRKSSQPSPPQPRGASSACCDIRVAWVRLPVWPICDDIRPNIAIGQAYVRSSNPRRVTF